MKSWPVQVAVRQALTNDATLMAMVSGVYDEVPEAVVFPYVEIGEADGAPFDTDDSIGSETVIALHVWSRYRGQKEVRQIGGAIHTALHRAALVVDGASLVTCEWESSSSVLDPDGITRHGVMQFRVTVENT